MSESERRQTQRSHSVASLLWGHTVVAGSFQTESEDPDDLHSSEFEIALDLHVDDGHMTGSAEKMMEVFVYLEGKLC